MTTSTRASTRPHGIAFTAVLLHILNPLTFLFLKWHEPDTPVLAAFVAVYVCFTAIVIQAYWKGEGWARWMILLRCLYVLAWWKILYWMAGFRLVQGILERLLAVFLLVYLNLPRIRRWFAGPPRILPESL